MERCTFSLKYLHLSGLAGGSAEFMPAHIPLAQLILLSVSYWLKCEWNEVLDPNSLTLLLENVVIVCVLLTV